MKQNLLFLRYPITLLCFFIVSFSSCNKDEEEKKVPDVITNAVVNAGATFAEVNCRIISDGNATITSSGVCWNTSSLPTIANGHTTDGSVTGTYVSTITGLTANTTYYIRSYAVNSVGISYGNEITFTTDGYLIGQNGQGGIVFYDKGSYSDGWRYLEAATSDQSTGAEWGCDGTTMGAVYDAYGTGLMNTNLITNACSTAGIAARLCSDLDLNGYSDWYLPTKTELTEMYTKLYSYGIGSFMPASYWSSTEGPWEYYYQPWSVDFTSGNVTPMLKTEALRVRAARRF